MKRLTNIDPETGKPRKDANPDEDEEYPDSSDLDNEFEELSREKP